jgi:hypothetical protein
MKCLCPLSQFRDIFGLPGQGVHQYTFLKVIVVDNIITIMTAVFLTYMFDIPFPLSIIGVYIVSIIVHMLFGVRTKTLTYLGFTS